MGCIGLSLLATSSQDDQNSSQFRLTTDDQPKVLLCLKNYCLVAMTKIPGCNMLEHDSHTFTHESQTGLFALVFSCLVEFLLGTWILEEFGISLNDVWLVNKVGWVRLQRPRVFTEVADAASNCQSSTVPSYFLWNVTLPFYPPAGWLSLQALILACQRGRVTCACRV